MIGILLCLIAFGTTVWAGRRSMADGVVAMLAWGYGYGILRANFAVTASHFIFDASLVGFFVAQYRNLTASSARLNTLNSWITALAVWPCVVAFLPWQDPLVIFVGLRSFILCLPMLKVGALLKDSDLSKVTTGLAILNIAALGVAVGEYFWGVSAFIPESAATALIYASGDVAGFKFLRIPATFGTAHLYGGTMVMTIPFLFGAWMRPRLSKPKRVLYLAGLGAVMIGVLMSATRLNFVIAVVLALFIVLGTHFSAAKRTVLIVLLLAAGYGASTNERFGRFKSLSDTDYVSDRIGSSVNRSFWEILQEHPFGNGLGGGGTSLPYFLQGRVRHPIAIESEYGRILLELGVVGLLLWIGFVTWFLLGSCAFVSHPWRGGRRLAWICCFSFFGIGLIGSGILTAIPGAAILLMSVGWVMTKPVVEVAEIAPSRRQVPRRSLPVDKRILGSAHAL